ncbi:SRPBCC domain-containing protein [bacterium]|nr:SRPBCC domain-containing protein [bacterium]
MARKTTYRSRIQRTIDAPAAKAFDAWVDAKTNAKWYASSANHDAKVGGAYSNSNGDKGQFLEVSKGKKLRYTWENPKNAPGTVVTVNFRPFGRNKCKVQVTHSKLPKKTDIDKFQEYWNWATDSLKSFIDNGRRMTMDAWKKAQAAEAKAAAAAKAAPAKKAAPARKPAAKKAAPARKK